jgi:HK97 family phage major capsid protein
MPNPVLDRLRADRQTQIEFVDQTLGAAERDGRDLVDAEVSNIRSARERIGQLDAQIEPLVQFEELRESSVDMANRTLGRPSPRRELPAADPRGEPVYRTVGNFLVDYIRSRDPREQATTRAMMEERIGQARAVANQTTASIPGLLPEPVVGPLVNLLDASRPLITSVGARAMGDIPGTKFYRPHVTQHTLVDKQTAEKAQLASRNMVIAQLEFAKDTYGGTLDVSRQAIDWSSPAAWDAITSDLANAYAIATEAATAAAFAAGVTQTQAAASDSLEDYTKALFKAAGAAYRGATTMPNALWVSLDMWETLGPMVDLASRLAAGQGVGDASLSDFSGQMLGVQRIVVPDLPDGTVIIGNTTLFEFYEQQIGLLSAVEPSLLGVEVAYGGYAAFGFIEPLGFSKITLPTTP